MATFRGFIAIDIPINEELKHLLDSLRKTHSYIKLVEQENIHITLKFLGETQEQYIDTIEHIMKESVQTITPFTITLKGTGVFPNEKYVKIIWVGIQNAESLKQIMISLNKNLVHLGFQKETKPFSPHLTIGRMKSATGKDEVLEVLRHFTDIQFAEIPVTSIKLKQSNLTPKGPMYLLKKEVKLEI